MRTEPQNLTAPRRRTRQGIAQSMYYGWSKEAGSEGSVRETYRFSGRSIIAIHRPINAALADTVGGQSRVPRQTISRRSISIGSAATGTRDHGRDTALDLLVKVWVILIVRAIRAGS